MEKKQRTLTGGGVEVAVHFCNTALSSSLTNTFEQVDARLQYLIVTGPKIANSEQLQSTKKKIVELVDAQLAGIQRMRDQFKAVAVAENIDVHKHEARAVTVMVHTPLARKMLSMFATADEATALLDGLWIMGILNEEEKNRHAGSLRRACHKTAEAIGVMYKDARTAANAKPAPADAAAQADVEDVDDADDVADVADTPAEADIAEEDVASPDLVAELEV